MGDEPFELEVGIHGDGEEAGLMRIRGGMEGAQSIEG